MMAVMVATARARVEAVRGTVAAVTAVARVVEAMVEWTEVVV